MHGSALRIIALIFFAAQIAFHHYSSAHFPDLGIVPPVPSDQEMAVSAMGDDQYLFRIYALNLQQAGDTFGRVTALYKYDYPKLEAWFNQMDKLDPSSHFFPALATYYFSQSQNKDDVQYVVNYLDAHSARDAQANWWWVVQAAYLSKHKLNDSTRAIAIAKRLEGVRGIPIWAQQYPAFLYEQSGEFDDALRIIQNIMDSSETLSPQDLSFMAYFAKDRLKKLEAAEKIEERLKNTQ